MNTRPTIDETIGPISLSASFNSTNTAFTIGLDTGFCVFHSSPCELKLSRDFNAGISTAELLDNSNYLALVGGGKNPKWPQTKVIIWDDAKAKPAVTLEFKTTVLRVRLTRTHIAVTLLNTVHLFAFSDPPKRTSVFETTDNPLGLLCLGHHIIAFPGRSPGKIQLVELRTGNVSIIPAHTSPLRALAFSPDGSLLASASQTGTLIRVFSTANCARTAELRRGVDPAFVFSIAFSPSAAMLAVTSDKSTLHVFDLPPRPSTSIPINADPEATTTAQSKWGIFSQIPLLPRIFSDIYSFGSAHFEISDDSSPSLPALGSLPARSQQGLLGWIDELTILVVGTGREGKWERFRVGERLELGGEEGQRGVWREGWKRFLGG